MSVEERGEVVASMSVIESYEVTGWETAVKAIGLSYAESFEKTDHAKSVAKMLLRGGLHSGEGNFLSGVNVSMMVNASLKWWQQAQRYHWFQIVMSQSVMHSIAHKRLDQMEFTPETPKEAIKAFGEIVEAHHNGGIDRLNLIYSVPSGFKEKARVSTNYLQLMNMVKQRENHTLPEWHQFCDEVKGMPHMDELLNLI